MIDLKNVSYKYQVEKSSIKDISLKIKKGKKLA